MEMIKPRKNKLCCKMMKDKHREIKEHEIPMNVTTKF